MSKAKSARKKDEQLKIIRAKEEKINIDEVKDFLSRCPEGTKLYLGCDSVRTKVRGDWYADYTIVLVVHKGGNNGCKIFGEITRERDYDQKKNRPSYRLMNEVYKVSEFYLKNYEGVFSDYKTEIHIDINPNEEYGSSCVISQAIGYIKGVCGMEPKVKPEAFGASYAADRYAEVQHHINMRAKQLNQPQPLTT